MKKFLTKAGVVAALTLTAITARAGCADPRAADQQRAFQQIAPLNLQQGPITSHFQNPTENIVGTWYVGYTSGGSPFGQALIQWHNDGTEWENINLPVLDGNLCMVSWKTLDRSHVFRKHLGWLYINGNVSGYFT